MMITLGLAAFSSVFLIPYLALDPVAFEIGPLSVRWYGLAYMAGLLLGWLYIKRLLMTGKLWGGQPPLTIDHADSMLLWATIGVVVGGRLGFVLFYEPSYFIQHPLEAFALWHGGMAFHGGLVGTGVAMWLFSRANKVSFFQVTDVVSAAVPIGLFFGRIANFINAEVVGRASDVPWAMVFPGAGPEPRHPSQLYEAALEGIVLFLVIRYFTHSRLVLRWPGYTTGLFLIGYGLARIFCELFREYDATQYFTFGSYLTTGMIYSLPMVLLGIYFLYVSRFRAKTEELVRGKGAER